MGHDPRPRRDPQRLGLGLAADQHRGGAVGDLRARARADHAVRLEHRTERALVKAGLTLDQIDLFEVNEAFASVVLAWQQTLGADPAKVNVNGGAIALGHPLGCTGAKLFATLLHELERQDLRYGLVTLCVGLGMGTATIIERL